MKQIKECVWCGKTAKTEDYFGDDACESCAKISIEENDIKDEDEAMTQWEKDCEEYDVTYDKYDK